MRRWSGFTFIELLLALLITALIAASAYSALSGFLRAREVHQQKTAELARLQRFFSVFSRDVRQAAPIVNRGADGDIEDAFVIGQGDDVVLVLNRRGWHNPQLATRSELQRVYYRLDGDSLIRGQWAAFDRVEQTPKRERTVLEGVRTVSFQALANRPYSDLDRAWLDEWPDADAILPAAVRMTLEIESFGEIERIYELLPQG